MEYLCKKYPVVGEMILKNLSYQSLARSKETSPKIANFLERERFYWIRVIKEQKKNFEGAKESWNLVINKILLDVVKNLAIDALEFLIKILFGWKMCHHFT